MLHFIFLKKSMLVNGHIRKDISSNEIVGVAASLFFSCNVSINSKLPENYFLFRERMKGGI